MLQLLRPLVFLDLETTGLDRENDRIVSFAAHKVYSLGEGGKAHMFHRLMNPGFSIPASATAIHGITDEMVASCPKFYTIAPQLYDYLDGCDLAGYGSNFFDVPLLYHEFSRAGIDWTPGHTIDVGNLFKIREPRTLEAAVRFYCNREQNNAHTADWDALNTFSVFQAQIQRYPDLPRTVEALALYTNHGHRRADIAGKFYIDHEGIYRFGFGRYKDKPALEYPTFLDWMLKGNFGPDTRRIVHQLLDEYDEKENSLFPSVKPY